MVGSQRHVATAPGTQLERAETNTKAVGATRAGGGRASKTHNMQLHARSARAWGFHANVQETSDEVQRRKTAEIQGLTTIAEERAMYRTFTSSDGYFNNNFFRRHKGGTYTQTAHGKHCGGRTEPSQATLLREADQLTAELVKEGCAQTFGTH